MFRELVGVHTVRRAQRMGSVDRIITAADLRPYLGDALERGMARTDQDGRRASEVRVTLRQT